MAGKLVKVSLGYFGGPDGRGPDVAKSLHLSYSYSPAAETSVTLVNKLLFDFAGDHLMCKVGIDGTLTFKKRLQLDSGTTADRLKYDLQHFELGLADIVREFPPAVKPVTYKLDENRKVDCLDGEDVRFLVHYWGIELKTGFGGSFKTWAYPASIEGIVIWLSGVLDDNGLHRTQLQVFVTFFVQDKAKVMETTQDLQRKLKHFQVLDGGDGRVGVQEIVELQGGVSLKDIKKRLLQFAKTVAPYAKGKQQR